MFNSLKKFYNLTKKPQGNIIFILIFFLYFNSFGIEVPVSSSADLSISNADLIISSNISIEYDLEIPSTSTLKFVGDGILNISQSVTLTINGRIEAGRKQIFNGLGIVNGSPKIECAYPEWFGSDPNYIEQGDDSTDITTGGMPNDDGPFIQKALNFAGKVSLANYAYYLRTSIIMKSGQSLEGSNFFSTPSRFTPKNSTVIIVSTNLTAITFESNTIGINIKNIGFFGENRKRPAFEFNIPAHPSPGSYGIKLTNASFSKFCNLDFHNLEKAVYSSDGNRSRHNIFEDISAIECGIVFDLNSTIADIIIRTAKHIDLCNQFINSENADGLTISDCNIFHIYNNSLYLKGTPGNSGCDIYTNISNCKFFETGKTQVVIDNMRNLTITGTSFVRAGFYCNKTYAADDPEYRTTALKIDNSSNVNIAGCIIERPLGHGIELTGSNNINIDACIYRHGWQRGGTTGIIIKENNNINIRTNITAEQKSTSHDAHIGINSNYSIIVNGKTYSDNDDLSDIYNANNISSNISTVPSVQNLPVGWLHLLGTYTLSNSDILLLKSIEYNNTNFDGWMLRIDVNGADADFSNYLSTSPSVFNKVIASANGSEITVRIFLRNEEDKAAVTQTDIKTTVNIIK